MAEDDVNLGQMLDLATPWCLHAAATLRIPEHIAAGHRDIGELADAGLVAPPPPGGAGHPGRPAGHRRPGRRDHRGLRGRRGGQPARRAGLEVAAAGSQGSGRYVVECRTAPQVYRKGS
jgi:hypothetical protein